MQKMWRAALWLGVQLGSQRNNMENYAFHSFRGCLSYLVVEPNSGEAALIDPTEEISDDTYLKAIEDKHLRLRYIIETHTHADHVSSAKRIREATGALLVRHALAPSLLKDITVVGGELIPLGSSRLAIVATPGHTNESISVITNNAVFTGDALLIGGTGRTDFQLGDSEALYTSLHDVFGALEDTMAVYPAHDYKGRTQSTIGSERLHNPRFLLPHDAFIAEMDAHHPPAPELFEVSIAENSR